MSSETSSSSSSSSSSSTTTTSGRQKQVIDLTGVDIPTEQQVKEMDAAWKRYPSISPFKSTIIKLANSAIAREDIDTGSLFYAVEKIHGVNFCLYKKGDVMRPYSRNLPLNPTDVFQDWQSRFAEQKKMMIHLQEVLASDFDTITDELQVYGELFGGGFHNNKEMKEMDAVVRSKYGVGVEQQAKAAPPHTIFPQMSYSSIAEFAVFDIYVPGRGYLDYNIVIKASRMAGFRTPPIVAVGAFEECCNFNVVDMMSRAAMTAETVTYPLPCTNSTCLAEGIVIRPDKSCMMGMHSRFIIKKKQKHFGERHLVEKQQALEAAAKNKHTQKKKKKKKNNNKADGDDDDDSDEDSSSSSSSDTSASQQQQEEEEIDELTPQQLKQARKKQEAAAAEQAMSPGEARVLIEEFVTTQMLESVISKKGLHHYQSVGLSGNHAELKQDFIAECVAEITQDVLDGDRSPKSGAWYNKAKQLLGRHGGIFTEDYMKRVVSAQQTTDQE